MGFVGIEEIFLKVQDLDRAIDFYHNKLGIPLDKRDHERAYLQCDRGHLVLQIANSTGRHQAGGPMHFAFTVTEETFDGVVKKLVASEYRTRGPIERQEPFKGGRCSSSIRTGTSRSEHALSVWCPVAVTTARSSRPAATTGGSGDRGPVRTATPVSTLQ